MSSQAESVAPARMVHSPFCSDPSKARNLCKCGANVGCPSCGWGSGQAPCACSPKLFVQHPNFNPPVPLPPQ